MNSRWILVAVFLTFICGVVFLRAQHHQPPQSMLDNAPNWHCGAVTETPDGGFDACPHVPNR